MTFAYCEPVAAWPGGPWHIRQVGPEGVSLRGPTVDPLCDLPPSAGWDLPDAVGSESLVGLKVKAAVCQSCVTEYEEQRGEEPT